MVLGVLTASWASGEDSASKMVPKRTPKCSQDGPRGSKEADLGEHGGEVGAKMALCWPIWRPRWPTWRHLGGHPGSFYRFGGAFYRNLENAKNLQKPYVFKGFWGWEGEVGRYLEAILGYVGATWL